MKVGLLGGGQLARMLVVEGFKLGLQMHVLSKDAMDPAAQVTRFWMQGDPDSASDVAQFAAGLDALTFESEFIDIQKLRSAMKGRTRPLAIEPCLDLIELFSDRKTQ